MTPEQKAREVIDHKLAQAGWTVQDLKQINLSVGIGVAVREFPTSTGPVDYALFVDGVPVGVVEAKKDDAGENLTVVEGQSNRYANSTFKWVFIMLLPIMALSIRNGRVMMSPIFIGSHRIEPDC